MALYNSQRRYSQEEFEDIYRRGNQNPHIEEGQTTQWQN